MIKKTLLIFVLIIFIIPLYSQYSYFFYGKNKVIQKRFRWQVAETDNFKIYYYDNTKEFIKKIAQTAETSYKKISDFLGIKTKSKVPLILYNSHIDFEQTNLFPGFMPPGVQAFAEPIAQRLVVQSDRSFEELQRTITHELGHIFEYNIIYNRMSKRLFTFNNPPLWVMEGFSEFITSNWDSFSLLTVRDSVLNNRIPKILKNGEMRLLGSTNRTPYDFGHILYEFIYKKYGKRGVKKLLYSYRTGQFFGKKGNFFKALSITPKQLNYEFGKYLRKRFKKYLLKENPEDYSIIIGPDFPFFYSFSHQISRTGEMATVLTVNSKTYKLDFIIISTKDGKFIRNITSGFTSKYDNVHLIFNPEDGHSFCWNYDDDKITFFARKELSYYLVTIDILNGKILNKIKIKNIKNPSSPVYLPSNPDILYFTGVKGVKSYIFTYNYKTKRFKRITDGSKFIKSIAISSDSKLISYSARINNKHKLFLAPLSNPDKAIQLTQNNSNEITPNFSLDNKKIFFSSDELGAYNIYEYEIDSKSRKRFTDVRTGNFYPQEIPNEKNTLLISSFHNGRFILFKKDISKVKESTQKETELKSSIKPEIKNLGVEFDINFKGKYKPFKKILVSSAPPIGMGYATDGSFLAYSYLHLTDLFNDHNFYFYLATQYGYQSINLSYFNKKNRLNYYFTLFSFSQNYYYPYQYYNEYYGTNYNYSSLAVRSLLGAKLGFIYPFSRDYRTELNLSFYRQDENFDEMYYNQSLPYGQFFNGYVFPIGLSLIGETTRFANYGPNRGYTFRITLNKYFKLSDNFLDAYSFEADFRKYFRISNKSLFAFRFSGYKSGGNNSLIYWIGGNNTIRSAYYRSLVGNNAFFLNLEYRFQLADYIASFIGFLGPIRGVFFFDMGGAWFNNQDYSFFDSGLKLKDGLASYGFGIEFFLGGWPMHIEWVYKTDFSEHSYNGVNFWIGFDF